eukprot:6845606-Alexandrium_andersonii.AAC.1
MLVSAPIRVNPQSAMPKMQKSLQVREPGTARAQERRRNRSPQLPRGAFCTASRADSESADESEA